MSYEQFSAPDKYRNEISISQADDYIAAAEKYYTNLPYHNWQHALAVIEGVDKIADKFEARGVLVARTALKVAAAWHNAGFHENHYQRRFSTKEDYSASLLAQFLADEPISYFTKNYFLLRPIAAMSGMHSRYRAPHDLILHRADIANIGGPTDEFIDINTRLWQENNLDEASAPKPVGPKTTWEQHVGGSIRFIENMILEHEYESLQRGLASDDTTLDVGDEPFAVAARKNINHLKTL